MKLERAFYLHTAPEGLRREGSCFFVCFGFSFAVKERKKRGLFWVGGREALFCFFLMQMEKRRKAMEGVQGRFGYFTKVITWFRFII